MRGDFDSNLRRATLQNDSSSDSSSPHSNSSQEDQLESRSNSEITSKAIFNFSIPEIIKHDPRRDREQPIDEMQRRKRERSYIINESVRNEPTDQSQSRKRRKLRTAGENFHDCHDVPVIDLTGIDSHDEQANSHSDLELSRNTLVLFVLLLLLFWVKLPVVLDSQYVIWCIQYW